LREVNRLAADWTYEPPTFYETNAAGPATSAAPCRFVVPQGNLKGRVVMTKVGPGRCAAT
jgi:hypothetical protein